MVMEYALSTYIKHVSPKELIILSLFSLVTETFEKPVCFQCVLYDICPVIPILEHLPLASASLLKP